MSFVAEPVRTIVRAAPETSPRLFRRTPLILVVEDGTSISDAIREICAFLGVTVDRVSADRELLRVLRERRPMAVIAELDGRAQDGCHVMMQVAEHDRALPVLLLTGPSPVLAGAADAVEELCALSAVTQSGHLPEMGSFVEFVFEAGRSGACLGLMPA